jgi:hypothetical protein
MQIIENKIKTKLIISMLEGFFLESKAYWFVFSGNVIEKIVPTGAFF